LTETDEAEGPDETDEEMIEPDSPAALTPASVHARVPLRELVRRLGPAERLSLVAFVVISLIGAVFFFKFLYRGKPDSPQERPLHSLPGPIRGELVTLREVEYYWRDRTTEDRGRSGFAVLPEVLLKLDPATSKAGYVRVEFSDGDGRLRGDVVTVKFENGKFVDSRRGERLQADGVEVALACTEGFPSFTLFQAYLGNQDPRWTVRIEEGPDYSNGPWKTLGFVEIRNEKK
jgi:hypothetical protein